MIVAAGGRKPVENLPCLTLLARYLSLWFCYNWRKALSAAVASCIAKSKKLSGWPLKSPSAVKDWTVATAPPSAVAVGRMTEQGGSASLKRKSHGSGRILLVWVSSSCKLRRARVAGSFRSGNVAPLGFSGSVTPASGWDTALNRPYKRAMATGFLKGPVACDGQRAGNSVPVRK
jgi:hypothetical protein